MKRIIAVVAAATSLLALNVSYGQYPYGRDATARAPAKTQSRSNATDTQFDERMKQMQVMHERMTAASTPEERQKAMEDARMVMQESMGSMQAMMGQRGMMGGGHAGPSQSERMRGMEQRVDMMQMMMQMMMDQQGMGPRSMGGTGPAK